MVDCFNYLLSGVGFDVIIITSILGIVIGIIYSLKNLTKYVISTWILTAISFYVITCGLYGFYKYIVGYKDYEWFNQLNKNIPYIGREIDVFINSGLATVLVLFILGFVSTSVNGIIIKLLRKHVSELDKEVKNIIFVRVIILNMFIFFAMGRIEYCLQLFAILLGKFIWIGTSKKDIFDEFRNMKCKDERKGDLESLVLSTILWICIMLGSVCYKSYTLVIIN
jgi:hypothetical protein